jgi:hypothetical protein
VNVPAGEFDVPVAKPGYCLAAACFNKAPNAINPIPTATAAIGLAIRFLKAFLQLQQL